MTDKQLNNILNINNVVISGTLKHNPLIRQNKFNKFVTYFKIEQHEGNVIPLVANDKLAELIYNDYKKGSSIVCNGWLKMLGQELVVIVTCIAWNK